MKKKILVITYQFPPSNGVAVHRILRLCKWLPKYGWEPIILTPIKRLNSIYDESIMEINKLEKKNIVYVESKLMTFFSKIAIIRNFVIKNLLKYLVWNNLIPDKEFPWIKPAVAKGVEITQKENVSAIWATIPNLSTGIIGSKIASKTKIPLIIDYRDPISLNPLIKQKGLKKIIYKHIEKSMLSKAKIVLTTSNYMKDLFVENKYFDSHNIKVLLNAYDKEIQFINNNQAKINIHKEYFNISHVGTFTRDRQPFSFIDGFKKLVDSNLDMDLKVNFIGNNNYDDIKKYLEQKNLSEYFNLIGQVSYQESIKYIIESDLLLLINGLDNSNKIFVPGKLFDYIAAEKPILFIGEGDPETIIMESDFGETARHECTDIYEKILKIMKNNNKYYSKKDKFIEHSAKCRSKYLSEILNSLR
jgi:glycosyltransferase involved in cell wall biosynthesis